MDISNLTARLNEIKRVAIDSLNTDGAHHKQYDLECILNAACDSEQEFERIKKEEDWEEGIPA